MQKRSLTRRRVQLTHDRVRTLNQVESLLEETRIKLSSKVSDLFGASALRILAASIVRERLAGHCGSNGGTDPRG